MRAHGLLVGVLLLGLAAGASALRAEPLVLAYGRLSQLASDTATTVGEPIALATLVEHVEFLLDHGVRIVDLGHAEEGGEKTAVLTFDDPESFERLVLPLLALWEVPAVVTVAPGSADASLRALSASPWVELVPRIDVPVSRGEPALQCDGKRAGAEPIDQDRGAASSELARTLDETIASLRSAGRSEVPRGVVWSPGAFSGPAESIARGLGLRRQLVTVAAREPVPGSIAGIWPRFPVRSRDGVWRLSQAAERWVPSAHPVRFVEVTGDWLCEGPDPEERFDRLEALVARLGLNGVRLQADSSQVDAMLPLLGASARRLRELETIRWILVDFPSTGTEARDVAVTSRLARAVDLDVAILPDTPWAERLQEEVLSVRPMARIAWRDPASSEAFSFGGSPRSAVGTGRTVRATDADALDREILRASSRGQSWLGATASALDRSVRGSGIPVEMALSGARDWERK